MRATLFTLVTLGNDTTVRVRGNFFVDGNDHHN